MLCDRGGTVVEKRGVGMTENEAIDELNTSIDLAKMCTENLERKREVQGYETAIKALKGIQQYRELEKRLIDMFGGEVSLETAVEELERYLKEPGNPHPINAKILTYEDAADWDAYRAIGTPEELITAMKYVRLAKAHRTVGKVIEECAKYEEIGTPEECRAAVEKQKAKKPILALCGNCQGSCDNCDRYIDRCPSCNGDLYSETSKHYDCCPNCGQRLDWSNEK